MIPDREKEARNYLIMQAIRRGLPIGFEEAKPLNELTLVPCVLNKAAPDLLPRMTKRQSAMDWLRNRITTAPKGV
jgi:hypothetical protein